jgi:hypothetical protein
MNNIKIRIPKKLYESIKHKAALREEQTLNEDNLSPDQLMQVIAGISSLGLGGLAIAKIQDYIKKKNPELYKKLEDTHATMDKAYRGGVDESIQKKSIRRK